MSKPGCYVDNATNRRLGRVGKPLGSHVVSKKSGVSYQPSGCYVDNAFNRKVGRVGKPLGTHVVSSNTRCDVKPATSCQPSGCYVDNAFNRKVGRVGKPLGTHVVSSNTRCDVKPATSCQPSGCYVDNAFNRKVGRVGKPLGTHVVSSNTKCDVKPATSCQPSGCHAFNRKVGRVGKPVGTHVVSSNTRNDERSAPSCQPSGCYVDNRKLGRVGKPLGSHVTVAGSKSRSGVDSEASGQPSGVYANNPLNRRLGRVGKPWETDTEHIYGDSEHNRRLGRVGKERKDRHRILKELVQGYTLVDISLELVNLGFSHRLYPHYTRAQELQQQAAVEEDWERKGIHLSTSVKCVIPEIIPHDDLNLGKQIGRGSFGEVYACLWRGIAVAFKKLLHQSVSKKRKQKFVKEIEVLVTLDHPNIVKVFGAVVEEGNVGCVMEYMTRTLYRALFYDEDEFEDAQKKKLVFQIACALLHLHMHEPAIVHCDIKSQNVLLDQVHNAKLCDFGLCAVKNDTETSISTLAVPPGQGTPRYSAPEVLRGEILTLPQLFKADIYSLAIVAFEVVVEEEPFEDLSVRQLEVQVGRGDLRPTSTLALSEPLSALLASSWDGTASNRPSADEFKTRWSKIIDLYAKS